MVNLIQSVKHLWSITSFNKTELHDYAHIILVDEARRGIMALSLLLIAMILSALPVYAMLELHPAYLYTYAMIAALSLHIYLSAKKTDDINVLHLFAIILLTISATAFISLSHQINSFSILLFANVILLFMAVPLVPWGLREASIVIFIIYSLLTFSTGGVNERFGTETFLVLQFFMIAASMTSIIIVARSVRIRKTDLSTRFDLEQARTHLYQLSNIDPLTGAWNRRFLNIALEKMLEKNRTKNTQFHYSLLDIDNFKKLNDEYGHDFGDRILITIGKLFRHHLKDNGYLVRMGGDEFSLLFINEHPHTFIDIVCNKIEQECNKDKALVKLSYGLVSSQLNNDCNLEDLYIKADKNMYEHKATVKNLEKSPTKDCVPLLAGNM